MLEIYLPKDRNIQPLVVDVTVPSALRRTNCPLAICAVNDYLFPVRRRQSSRAVVGEPQKLQNTWNFERTTWFSRSRSVVHFQLTQSHPLGNPHCELDTHQAGKSLILVG